VRIRSGMVRVYVYIHMYTFIYNIYTYVYVFSHELTHKNLCQPITERLPTLLFGVLFCFGLVLLFLIRYRDAQVCESEYKSEYNVSFIAVRCNHLCVFVCVCESEYKSEYKVSFIAVRCNHLCGFVIFHIYVWSLLRYAVAYALSHAQCVAVCCSVLQCVAVCCSVLQCVAVCCSVLQWGLL